MTLVRDSSARARVLAPHLGRGRNREALSRKDIETCRSKGESLAFDPAQNAWVRLDGAAAQAGAGHGTATQLPNAERCEILALRYKLRRWELRDAGHYRVLLDDPQIWRFLPEDYPAPLTEKMARILIEVSNLADHHEVRAIERNGKLVGQVRLAFEPGSPSRTSGEISYWIGRDWWGRGIATDALSLFIWNRFRKSHDLQSVFARVHRDNRGSAQVLAKIGFLAEGPAADNSAIEIYRLHKSALGRHG